MVAKTGIAPMTQWFSVTCSTPELLGLKLVGETGFEPAIMLGPKPSAIPD